MPVSRAALLERLDEEWDLVVVGGGITGAAILLEAVRRGHKALLLEGRDFAWGASSRSSKLVHGGLRYLKQGDLGLTRESTRERERLLEERAGLVSPLGFVLSVFDGDSTPSWLLATGLTLYDLLGGPPRERRHRRVTRAELLRLAPGIAYEGLHGGFIYYDAATDDARLVLTLLREATLEGGVALNHVRVSEVLRAGTEIAGVAATDSVTGRSFEIAARCVINATGAQADFLRTGSGASPRMRPLRGSHLVLPARKLPVKDAIGFQSPRDQRPLFVIPWQGVVLLGTTDLDHRHPLDVEPRISPEEIDYLMSALAKRFPEARITEDDVLGSWAGVRPVVGTGAKDPSKESREHVLWNEKGLLTVTGGKLTTFQVIAKDALRAARSRLPEPRIGRDRKERGRAAGALAKLSGDVARALVSRHGSAAEGVADVARPGELARIPDSPYLWAEVRHALRHEWVVHLDDLLLRRVRLGFMTRDGGAAHLARLEGLFREELAWDEARWEAEKRSYLELFERAYSFPGRGAPVAGPGR
ncbi:MAG: glycerol-3-phosphate dehydrogenase/oxidase [Acidobacteria bacterium]|nr:glycerol-3-phosphate dehydrogenase/oxidase [Acidobacteriota bacterium]